MSWDDFLPNRFIALATREPDVFKSHFFDNSSKTSWFDVSKKVFSSWLIDLVLEPIPLSRFDNFIDTKTWLGFCLNASFKWFVAEFIFPFSK